ncbi:MAG TPA: alpha/beta fold hydrolase [bacterium]|nr:alpha/beta fold hydrolase [bacterium]
MRHGKRLLPLGLGLTFALTGRTAADVREIGELVLDGIPEIPQELIDRTNQYQNVRQAQLAGWSPDGGLLIVTRFGETAQLHHVAEPGAARRQITFCEEPVADGSFGTSPDWLLFSRDRGGNEAQQIFRLDLRVGREALLTDGEHQNGAPLWSNRRDRVAYRSTARNGKDHDIWVLDPLRPEERAIVLETDGYWFPVDWSPDDRRLIVANFLSITESYFWALDLESGEKLPIARHEPVDEETIFYSSALFDAGGDGVFFVSDESSEFWTLRWTKLGSDDVELLSADIPWSVTNAVMSPDRSTLAFTVNDNGRDRIYFLDTRSRKRRDAEAPLGMIEKMEFSPDGKTLAFQLESPAWPTDVYTMDVKSRKVTRWTESEVGGLNPDSFVLPEIVMFPTFDEDSRGERRRIPAHVYRPRGEGPFPVVIRIHGGPESQARMWFSYTSQFEVAEQGCAVIYPNVRGSVGYGKTYVKLDNGALREDSVKDIGALLDWIAEQPDLDQNRVAVTGGSYGGYMVLAALTHYPDRIRCGVDAVGISNFVTFLENTSDYRRDLRRVEYGDERDPEMRALLEKISPTNNVDKINAPLLVIQGANDPRVPASEAEQIVKAVRANGKEAWYLLARDEGHGFAKKSNSDWYTWTQQLFWQRYLVGDGETGASEGDAEAASSH